jgi:hypothetical protein
VKKLELLQIPGPGLVGFDHVFAGPSTPASKPAICGACGATIERKPELMMGLDWLATEPVLGSALPPRAQWDEVIAPYHVILNPKAGQSTVFGDPLRGIPSGVARVVVAGGIYSKPDPTFMKDANVWNNPATVTVYFANGARQTFAGLQAVTCQGGTLRQGIGQRAGWLARIFGGAA